MRTRLSILFWIIQNRPQISDLDVVRRLFCICHRLPCRWAARDECEGGYQEEEKFCLFHLSLNSFHYSLREVCGRWRCIGIYPS